MEIKTATKGNRTWGTLKPKTSPVVPNMELVTKNVFIPVTKVIFTRKRERIQRVPTSGKVKLVKPGPCNSNRVISLLKKPFCLPAKSYASAVPYSKQTNKLREREKTKMQKKSSVFINARSNTSIQRLQSKNRQMLLFPSSISDLPLALNSKYMSALTNKSPFVLTGWNKTDKVDRTEAENSVEHLASNVAKTKKNHKKLKRNQKVASVMCCLQNFSRQTGCLHNSFGKARILGNDGSCNQVTFNSAANMPKLPMLIAEGPTSMETANINATATPIKIGIERYPLVPYLGFDFRDIDTTVEERVSNDVINQGEEIKFPVKHIKSANSNHAQRTIFNTSTSNRCFITNESRTLENVYPKITSSTCSLDQFSWKNLDHSMVTFIGKNERYPSDTELGKVQHRSAFGIKYSWQVVGTSSQTSKTLLESLIKENSFLDDESTFNCCIKYSWQIIGIATQTSVKDFTIKECRSAVSFLFSKANNIRRNTRTICEEPVTTIVWRNGKRFIVLNNQATQTFAHKDIQTIFTEFYT